MKSLLMDIQSVLIRLLKYVHGITNKSNKEDNKNNNTEDSTKEILDSLDNLDVVIESIEGEGEEQEKKHEDSVETIPQELESEPKSIIDRLKELALNKQYLVFNDNTKSHNVNLWFVRASNKIPNSFDDLALLFYLDTNNEWVFKSYKITTDPGLDWLQSPMNVRGTAILSPGQYRGTHKLDIHRADSSSAHKALCQRLGKVSVFRDNNRNEILDLDPSTLDEGMFGINIHQPTLHSQSTGEVSWSSAGCLVFSNRKDFSSYREELEVAATNWGNKFSITLITEEDLVSNNLTLEELK